MSKKEWPDPEYQMQAHAIKSQTEAYVELESIYTNPAKLPRDVFRTITQKSKEEWPDPEYQMQVHAIKSQTEAYLELNNNNSTSTIGPVTEEPVDKDCSPISQSQTTTKSIVAKPTSSFWTLLLIAGICYTMYSGCKGTPKKPDYELAEIISNELINEYTDVPPTVLKALSKRAADNNIGYSSETMMAEIRSSLNEYRKLPPPRSHH